MTPEERKAKVAWLNRAFHAEKNARAWLAKLERDKALAERISRNASESAQNGSGGVSGNTTETYLIRLAETQERVQEALRALVDIREEITHCIEAVEDLDAQTILVRHFLGYEPLDLVAAKTNWGRTTVYRKYKLGLEMLVLNGTS